MRNSTIKTLFESPAFNWGLISAIIILVIMVNGILASRTIEQLSTNQSSLYNTGEVIAALDNLHVTVLSAETGQRGYLLTEVEEYLSPYEKALVQLSEQLNALAELEFELPAQKLRLQALLLLIDLKLEELTQTIDLAKADQELNALKVVLSGRGRDLYREFRRQLEQIKTVEIEHRDGLYNKLASAEQEAKVTFLISGITSILLLAGITFLVRTNTENDKKYRLELEKQNAELVAKVAARTQELTIYSEVLAKSNQELEDFAFVASHDLQEPLRKIRAFGDRLKNNYAETLDGTGLDYIKRMQNAALRMSNLINDLLEFSRISTRGKEFSEISLNNVIEEIISDHQISIEESNTQIKVCDLPDFKADKSQMHQLFLNLISNAIKFRNPTVSPVISIEYEEQEINRSKWRVITVRDNGIGFEQQFADKIFAPFQRLHARSSYKGTGIGLAICRRIVERHGGKITATSEVGTGSVFKIEMPFIPSLLNIYGEKPSDHE